jgi:hypothetical protein
LGSIIGALSITRHLSIIHYLQADADVCGKHEDPALVPLGAHVVDMPAHISQCILSSKTAYAFEQLLIIVTYLN